jgi:hypothetical protein
LEEEHKSVVIKLDKFEAMKNDHQSREKAIGYLKRELENQAVNKPAINVINTRHTSKAHSLIGQPEKSKAVGKFISHSSDFAKNLFSFKQIGIRVQTLSINKNLFAGLVTQGKASVKVESSNARDGRQLT